MKVYLCGTITAQPRHLLWRQRVERVLGKRFQVLNPLRYQDPVNFSENGLHDATVPDKFLVAMDMMNLNQADVVFVVFWQQARQSVGTWMEMGAAAAAGKPIILVTDDPLVEDHPFIHQFAAVVCRTVEEGLAWIKRIE